MSIHVYISNRCPSSILPNNITLYKRVFDQLLSINHLQVFGSKCFIKVPDEMRSKLDDNAWECHLIGFKGDSIYIIVDADKKKLRFQNIIFVAGTGNRHNKNGPPPLELATVKHIPNVESEETWKKRTRSKVWGTNPISLTKESVTNSSSWKSEQCTRYQDTPNLLWCYQISQRQALERRHGL